jgi:hypothetical protein
MLKRDEICDRTAKTYLSGMRNVPTYHSLTEFKEVKNVSGFIKKLQTGDLLNCVILNTKTQHIYEWTRCKQHRCENLKYRTDLPTFPRTTPVIYTASGSRNNQLYKGKGKGNAITVQTWTGPEGSGRLRLPDFMTNGTRR